MTYRTFRDPAGQMWRVWLVNNSYAERRQTDRRKVAGAAPSYERRSLPDRRKRPTIPRSAVAPGFEKGWLCFESEKGEKRRLAPVPAGWERASDDKLWRMIELAASRYVMS